MKIYCAAITGIDGDFIRISYNPLTITFECVYRGNIIGEGFATNLEAASESRTLLRLFLQKNTATNDDFIISKVKKI